MSKPAAPKRPLSGYFVFLAEVRPKVVKEHPKFTNKEVISECGKQWNSLSEAKRKPYQEKSDALKTKYESDLKKYIAKYGQPEKKQRKSKKPKAEKVAKASKKIHKKK